MLPLLSWGCAEQAPPLAQGEAPPRADSRFALAPEQKALGGVESYVTQPGDTLLDVAMRYDLGYTQLAAANRDTDPWVPGAGKRVALPAFYLLPEGERRGIVVNVAQQRLYYFPPGGKAVETFPIGTSVEGRATPVGVTRITAKREHPIWYPPPSIREEKPELPGAVPAGPDNPLGDYAFNLGWPGYLIHGTNKPYGIGRNVSHGCIQLYPDDIKRLFREVPVGTPVRIVDEDVAVAWIGDDLYLAAYPSKKQAEELGVHKKMTPALPSDIRKRALKAAGPRRSRIDWKIVEKVGIERSGIPTLITRPVVTRPKMEVTSSS